MWRRRTTRIHADENLCSLRSRRFSPVIRCSVGRLDIICAMRKVTHVEPREGFKVWLRFDDDIEGEVDLSDLAGRGVFSAWSDRAFFESVSLGPDRGITWPGELDLCADSLYFGLTGKSLRETEASSTAAHA